MTLLGVIPGGGNVAAEPEPPQPPLAGPELDQAPMDMCRTAGDGYLSGELYGAIRATLDWHGTDMDCGGMLRPENGGIRLVFAAPRQQERLLILLGIDGMPDELQDAEWSVNVTIIDETRKRFFSAGGRERCWSRIDSVEPVDDGEVSLLQVSGELYCAGSLPSLSDNSSVTLGDMRFSGRLLLDEPDPE